MENTSHKHTWIEDGNKLKCECGKTKLNLKNGNISSNIYIGVKSDGMKYTVRANRDRILFPDEWLEIIKHCKEKQLFTFKFLLLTGARIMEAQGVTVDDVDMPNNRIVLRKTKRKSKDNISNKSKTRTLRVSTELIKDIKKRINMLGLKKEDTLKLLSQPAAHIALKEVSKKAGIKDYKMISVHSLRKTSENWSLAIGVDSMKLSTRFGHNLITQYEHYSQSDSFNVKEKMLIKEILSDTYIE